MVKTTQEKEKTTVKEGKKTRGKVDAFDRVVWNYMKKQHMLTETQILQLKVATCPAKVNGMAATLVCSFNPDIAKEKGVTVEDGKNGFIVREKDSKALAGAFERLFNDERLRREMGTAGHAKIDGWTPQQAAEGFVQALEYVQSNH